MLSRDRNGVLAQRASLQYFLSFAVLEHVTQVLRCRGSASLNGLIELTYVRAQEPLSPIARFFYAQGTTSQRTRHDADNAQTSPH